MSVPLSKLDAVNQLLAFIGEDSVSTIPTSGVSDATIAAATIDAALLEVLTAGLQCNVDRKYPLSPNIYGRVLVPANVLNLDGHYASDDFTQRGDSGVMYVYDKTNMTYTFTGTIYCDITWWFDFANLPQHVRDFITKKALVEFEVEAMHESGLRNAAAWKFKESLRQFTQLELRNNNKTLVSNCPTVAKIMRRY